MIVVVNTIIIKKSEEELRIKLTIFRVKYKEGDCPRNSALDSNASQEIKKRMRKNQKNTH